MVTTGVVGATWAHAGRHWVGRHRRRQQVSAVSETVANPTMAREYNRIHFFMATSQVGGTECGEDPLEERSIESIRRRHRSPSAWRTEGWHDRTVAAVRRAIRGFRFFLTPGAA